jgi:hypothetical protein
MKNLKKIILLTLFFVGFTSLSSAQVLKVKADAISFKTKNEYTGRWSDWSKWEEVNILITIDPDKERIKIFSKKDQVYDIIQDLGENYDKDGDKTLKWLCVNEDGLRCHVRLVKLYSQGGKSQLYVDFNDMMWVYNIYSID